jgi:hypothetical protein
MTLSPMEPDVSYYSCHGFEKHAGLQVAQNAQAQLGRILVFPSNISSEHAKFFHRQPRSVHEADQRLSGSRSCHFTRHLAAKKSLLFGG